MAIFPNWTRIDVMTFLLWWTGWRWRKGWAPVSLIQWKPPFARRREYCRLMCTVSKDGEVSRFLRTLRVRWVVFRFQRLSPEYSLSIRRTVPARHAVDWG